MKGKEFFRIGDNVRFGSISGEYRGIFCDDIAMVLAGRESRLYYVSVRRLSKINNK